MFVMVLGAGIYSYMIGTMANTFINSGSKESILNYKKIVMDSFCQATLLSKKLRSEIKDSLKYNSYKNIINS